MSIKVPELETPLFIRPPKFVSWNCHGKCLWGGETAEGVMAPDPEGPAVFIGERDGSGYDYLIRKIADA